MYSGSTSGGSTAEGGRRTFGTSGLLYRSNKLMFDRQSLTLWSNLTGEAVVGLLTDSAEPLEVLPVTLTTWGKWRRAHPEATVMLLDAAFGARWGFRYRPGAADQARAGVRFPIWLKDASLDPRAEVYAVRLQGTESAPEGRPAAKAYPIELALELGVINDRLGAVGVVVVADREGGAVRAYRARGHTFRPGPDGTLVDETGRHWRVEEESLVPGPAPGGEAEAAARAGGEGAATGSGGAESTAGGPPDERTGAGEPPVPLPRLPGHRSLWFAWYGFFPDTETYGR